MNKPRSEIIQILLILVIIVLLVANLFLFLRMDKLQRSIVEALRPCSLSDFDRGLPVGSQAPPFILLDVYGVSTSLGSFSGNQVLLMFSSTQCPTCQKMYAVLNEFHAKYPELLIVMISRGTEEENLSLVEKEGLKVPILTWQDDIAQAYQIPGTPYFYLLDSQGIIQNQGVARSLKELEELAGLSQ